jgi:prepilin-type N-terminal cleavage/methylation domain-containing protein
LHFSTTKTHLRAQSRGFTLLELMVVVIIIAILAVIAVPTFANRMRERRVQQAAGEVASLYRSARTRALGRGAAVLVRYNDTTGFEVFESIVGAKELERRERETETDCSALPGRSCLQSAWDEDNTRSVGVLTQTSYTTVATFNEAEVPALEVCFTPSGRSFVRRDDDDPLLALTTPITFRLKSTVTNRDRDVIVLPNGTARLAL